MAGLSNPRHERFAQELANGKTAEEAHRIAGFKPNRGNAATLKQNQSILYRVAEILAEREAIHGQATAEAIKSAGLSKEWVIERLIQNVERSMQATPPIGEDGKPTGDYQYQGSVANKALELLGKELGMFVAVSKHEHTGKDGKDLPTAAATVTIIQLPDNGRS